MANIPVKRKNTTPWWLLGLAAILLAGGAYVVGDLVFDDEPDDYYGDIETEQVAVTTAVAPDRVEPVTDGYETNNAAIMTVGPLLRTPMAHIGNEVSIPNLRVVDVIGDKTFIVRPEGSDSNRRMLVSLDQEMTPGVEGIEGRYDVNPGQILTVYGHVARMVDDPTSKWGVTAAEVEPVRDNMVYLHADQLDITTQDLQTVEVD